jgi:hypothetical protein
LVYIKNFSNIILINLLYLEKLINELQTRETNNPTHAGLENVPGATSTSSSWFFI